MWRKSSVSWVSFEDAALKWQMIRQSSSASSKLMKVVVYHPTRVRMGLIEVIASSRQEFRHSFPSAIMRPYKISHFLTTQHLHASTTQQFLNDSSIKRFHNSPLTTYFSASIKKEHTFQSKRLNLLTKTYAPFDLKVYSFFWGVILIVCFSGKFLPKIEF